MFGGIKVFMDMTALAIFINNFVVLRGREFTMESVFNAPFSAPRHEKNQCGEKNQKKNNPVVSHYL